MGAWIEIISRISVWLVRQVAPYVGAWIEMHLANSSFFARSVAPYVGAWIEMSVMYPCPSVTRCRSLCGSVD